MNFFVKVLYLNLAIICVHAQSDGRYRPLNSITTKRPVVIGDGRNRPSNDGRYNPANDGRYRPSNDGKYVHIGDKDRGQYSGGGGEYTGGGGEYTGGGGQYTGSGGQYSGSGGQYTGSGGQYTGSGGQYTGSGSQYTGSGGQNTGNSGGLGKYAGGGGGTSNRGSGKIAPKNEIYVPETDRRFGVISQTTSKPKLKPITINNGGNDGWKIIRDEKTEDTDGYHYLYETENGILAEESGRIENLAPNEDGLRSKGFYQYTGDDGILYRVDYVADNNGFVPQGDHIPKTPPAIQKLLDYLATQS